MTIHSDEYADLLVADGGVMRTHVFRLATDGRYPGMVLYSEIYRVTDPLRRLAAFMAVHWYQVATAGVCVSGHLAYRAALNPRVSAAACFYSGDISIGSPCSLGYW